MSRRVWWMHAVLVALPALASCNEAASPDNAPNEAPPATFDEQVALGADAYAASCATCHGDSGQGTSEAPRLVGLAEGALPLDPPPDRQVRKTQFVTVADVATFAVTYMPPDDPGSLDPETYWAILAFDLKANGITLDEKLTPELAETLTIPRE